MVALLVAGVMHLRTMGLVTAAITVERLAPQGEAAARVIGAISRRHRLASDCARDRARVSNPDCNGRGRCPIVRVAFFERTNRR